MMSSRPTWTVYCNARIGTHIFQSQKREALRQAVDKICPYYAPLHKKINNKEIEAPHDSLDYVKTGALVNLRHWTKSKLPNRIIEVVQVELANVSANNQTHARMPSICLGFPRQRLISHLLIECLLLLCVVSLCVRNTASR